MLTAVIALVIAVAALVLFLFVLVVVGIHAEPPLEELRSRTANPIAAMSRRLLGVYVRKPSDSIESLSEYFAGHAIGHDAEGDDR
jgi:hypothetical protein